MLDTELERPFGEKYNIVAEEYEGVPITTLPFSVRVVNRFMGNGIATVADLLKATPAALMKLKGFGKNCLDEVDAFCAKLNDGDVAPLLKTKKRSHLLLHFLLLIETKSLLVIFLHLMN